MPRWLGRTLFALRGKRLVRLHLVDEPGMQTTPSIDGVLVGRWAGHYVLELPKVVRDEDDVIPVTGTVEVPAERVLFVQVNPQGARR